MAMNPHVIAVDVLDDYKLRITFANDEVRVFDVTPYWNYPAFKQLQNKGYFALAKPATEQFVGLTTLIFVPIRFT